MSGFTCPKCFTPTLYAHPSYSEGNPKLYDILHCDSCGNTWFRGTREPDDEVMEFNSKNVPSGQPLNTTNDNGKDNGIGGELK